MNLLQKSKHVQTPEVRHSCIQIQYIPIFSWLSQVKVAMKTGEPIILTNRVSRSNCSCIESMPIHIRSYPFISILPTS